MLRERGAERPASALIVSIRFACFLDGLGDVAGQLGHEAIEGAIQSFRRREEQRPGRERPTLESGNVDGDAEDHGASLFLFLAYSNTIAIKALRMLIAVNVL